IEMPTDAPSLGKLIGFQTGDTLISFKGEHFQYFGEYQDEQILLADDAYFEVQRQGKIVKLEVPSDIQNYFSRDSIETFLFLPNIPAIAGIDTSASTQALPAFQAGIRNEDQIIRLDSTPIRYFSDLRAFMVDKAKRPVIATVLRGSDTLTFEVQVGKDPILGVRPNYEAVFEIETVDYSFLEAFIPGTKRAFGFVSANVQGFKNLTRSEVSASESVMGPVQIAKLYLTAFNQGGVEAFLRLTGMLSMILAFVNILPIPALDGGHVVFLLIEGITRREPSTRVRIIAQQVGMLLILGLMVVILFNDFFRVIFG
ncbi:MAG: M50 family metallopeptidase, partial [Bacteroidota bacterium]